MPRAKHGMALLVVTGLALAAVGASASNPDTNKLPFAEFWAAGTSTKQTCNTTQTCITGSGSGRLKVSFAPPGPLVLLDTYNWSASFTVDRGNATPNGFGGKCAPVAGTVAFTPPWRRYGNAGPRHPRLPLQDRRRPVLDRDHRHLSGGPDRLDRTLCPGDRRGLVQLGGRRVGLADHRAFRRGRREALSRKPRIELLPSGGPGLGISGAGRRYGA
jgi:hypothetical protein